MGPTDKMSEKGTKEGQVFKPTKKMLMWLLAAADPEVKSTISAISATTEIDRKAWYRWMAKPEFVAWWNLAWEDAMIKAGWWLDKVGMQKSVKDYRYWEAMQMKYQKFAKKEEHTHSVSFLEGLDNYENSRRFPEPKDSQDKGAGEEPKE